MKKITGAALRSHLMKVVRSIAERTKCGVALNRAIAMELNRSPYLVWGDVTSAFESRTI